MTRYVLIMGVLLIMMSIQTAYAVSPNPDEINDASKWVKEHFKQVQRIEDTTILTSKIPKSGLTVLSNNGPVQLNARADKPLKIGDTEYSHGLYCHAISKVVVRLPGPGRTFNSVIGIDSHAGGGSVVYSVKVGGQEAYKSDILHCGQPGVPISVDLHGATEFTLEVGDAGDGIACDQANWAEAAVILEDGSEVHLGDMQILTPELHDRSMSVPPFSFIYNGKSSDSLLGAWDIKSSSRRLKGGRTQTTQTYTDPQTGLSLRIVLVQYADYPTVEYTLYLKNTGTKDTPIIEDILPMDIHFRRTGSDEFTLRYLSGDSCTPDSYEPHAELLKPGTTKRFAPAGGRPTSGSFPYYNIQWSNGGAIAVLSWAGQWSTNFVRDNGNTLRITGGQELTHFKLHPGEEVRTPMVVLQFYKGDWLRAQNIWRHWMLDHNYPRPGGKQIKPMLSSCIDGLFPGLMSTKDDEIRFMDTYDREGVKLNYWWIDAGWYKCDPNIGWPQVGTWEVDTNRFPGGLKAVSDHIHSLGMKFIVWFEPERVHPGSWLADNHPEWIYGGKSGGLLKIGDPECRTWLTDHIDKTLREQGIDLYRQDFNIDPLSYWRANDSEDRQGITEIYHIMGYFAFWDELLRRHPGMLIDSCASGGRRNDVETLRRAVPLLRSDYQFEPVGNQSHTYGISMWFPYYGTGIYLSSPYDHRSSLAPAFGTNADVRKNDNDYDLYRRMITEARMVTPYFLGDYYPLTSYTLKNDDWIAWQFDLPEKHEGMAQVFRRAENGEESQRLRLQGLEPDAQYTVTDLDADKPQTLTGKQMMSEGIQVNISEHPGSRIIIYKKLNDR